jgi:ankyrin repeat protein
MDRLREAFAADSKPAADEVTNAFWCACHGGKLEAAQYLLAQGAELNWVGYDGLTPLGAAIRNGTEELVAWLKSEGAASRISGT